MFNLKNLFTQKSFKPTQHSKNSFEELLFLQLRSAVDLDIATRANLKKRLINQIKIEQESLRFEKALRPHRLRLSSLFTFRTFYKTVASLLLFFVIGGFYLALSSYRDIAGVQQIGWVSVESGIVRILPAGGEFFHAVTGEVPVKLGDTIRVGLDSVGSLRFWDASKMRLTPETEVAITDFQLDALENQKSAVRVALLSGSVDTVVNREKTSPAFEIATPSGNVAAKKAKFSVSMDKQTGKVKVATSESSVAVTSSESREAREGSTVALVAGQTAVFSDDQVLVADNSDAESEVAAFTPPVVKEVLIATDFLQIHLFDALRAVQDGDTWVAQQIETGVEQDAAKLLRAFGIAHTSDQVSTLLQLVQKYYPDEIELTAITANLQHINAINQILNYYFIKPNLLRGIPEFELLARSGYQPIGELQNLFTLLRARQLAYSAIQPTVRALTTGLLTELSVSKELPQLLPQMNQPVYLFALRELATLLPAERQALITVKITELEAQVQKYIGG